MFSVSIIAGPCVQKPALKTWYPILGFDRLAHFCGKPGEVVRSKQPAIRLHVIANATGDWTTIEIVACRHESGVTVISRAFGGEALSPNDFPQRPRQIGLHE
jgi:hypothetical protein